MKKRVAIYTRVSSYERNSKHSILSQINLLQNTCSRNDWEIYNIYTDIDVSVKNSNGPALLDMNADAEQGNFDIIPISKLNKLGLSSDSLHKSLEHYIKYDIKLYSALENIVIDPAEHRLLMKKFEVLKNSSAVKEMSKREKTRSHLCQSFELSAER